VYERLYHKQNEILQKKKVIGFRGFDVKAKLVAPFYIGCFYQFLIRLLVLYFCYVITSNLLSDMRIFYVIMTGDSRMALCSFFLRHSVF
jgi:hypothetical protein